MTDKIYKEYLLRMEHGGLPAFIGFHISAEQYYGFAEVLARSIYRIGWTRYKEYMDHLLCRLLSKEVKDQVQMGLDEFRYKEWKEQNKLEDNRDGKV